MRILVVQLLRLGDILMSAAAIKGLQAKYPTAKIDLLVNSEFQSAQDLVSISGDWLLFPRKKQQELLKDSSVPLFHSLLSLKEFLSSLRARNYDLVVNLTHNKLSAYLVGAIGVQNSLGACAALNGNVSFGSPWFSVLDENQGLGKAPYHIIDLWGKALSISIEGDRLPLGANHSKPQVKQKRIIHQVLTSEGKKNWGISSWAKLINNLGVALPDHSQLILAAPSEESKISELLRFIQKNLDVSLVVCSLTEALDIIAKSSALVTVDTSIKHLASATDVPIIELSLGSSNSSFTGAWSTDSLIVEAKLPCAPCGHSGPCRQTEHLCSNYLDSNVVSAIVEQRIRGNWFMLEDLASTHAERISIHRTHHRHSVWKRETLGPKPKNIRSKNNGSISETTI